MLHEQAQQTQDVESMLVTNFCVGSETHIAQLRQHVTVIVGWSSVNRPIVAIPYVH